MQKQWKIAAVALWIALGAVLVGWGLAPFLSYSVASEEREMWLWDHWEEHRRAMDAEEPADAVLLTECQEGPLTAQVWQLEINGMLYDDVVVWRQGPTGAYRVEYEDLAARATLEGDWSNLAFGFSSGGRWYSWRCNTQGALTQPRTSVQIRGVHLLAPVLLVLAGAATALWVLASKRERD